MHVLPLITLASWSVPVALAARYTLSDKWVGRDFLTAFTHEAIADPTHGRVNYVDEATAVAKGYTVARGNTLILRADDTTVLDPSGPGRDSVRIRSVNTYSTHVAIFDIKHMPQGCGTWPAVWETDENSWPNGGEVDIVEGVNDQSPNQMTLHTGANCTMPDSRPMSGTALVNNCDVNTDGYAGCGVKAPDTNSYGPQLNNIGGGFYAIERTNDFIKIWFWPRFGFKPLGIDAPFGPPVIDTDTWGTPTANFPSTSCDIASHFDAHNIIINLTFCGDWAGQDAVYASSGCPSSCVDYVNNNPTAFSEAFWEFNSIRVYEPPHRGFHKVRVAHK